MDNNEPKKIEEKRENVAGSEKAAPTHSNKPSDAAIERLVKIVLENNKILERYNDDRARTVT